MRDEKLSIVIAVYNEEKTILQILYEVEDSLKCLCENKLIHDFEIIVINDGSTDETLTKLNSYLSEKIKIISLDKNKGKGNAIALGFRVSSGTIVLIQDADLEYSPSDFEKLIRPIVENKFDIVFGSRFMQKTAKHIYFVGGIVNRVLTTLSNFLSGIILTDEATCYKAMRGDIARSLKLTTPRFGIDLEIIAKLAKRPDKCRFLEVPISYKGRGYFEGKKISWKDGIAAFVHVFYFNLFSRKDSCFHLIEDE